MATKQTTIGSLRVQLGLDSAELDKDLKAAQGKLDGFAKKMSTAGLALGAALTGAAVAMGAAVKGSLDQADEMVKTAAKVGLTVEELSKLKHAADLSGVSLDGLSGGLRKLSQNLVATAEGGSNEAAKAFQRLGISVTDSNGQVRDASSVMDQVAARFAAMPDGVQKTADAVAIFGRSGADLIPMLNGGADGLAAMKAEAEALGIVIDEDTARSAEQFNDNLSRLKKVGEGMTNQLAASLAPALANVSEMLVGAAQNTQLMDSAARALGFGFKVIVSGAVVAGGVVKYLVDAFGGLARIFMQIYRRDFSGALETYKKMWADAWDTTKGTAQAVAQVWTGAGVEAAQAAKLAVENGVKPAAVAAVNTVKRAADDSADAVDELQQRLDRVRDRLLTPQERRAEQIREDVRTVQEGFRRGKIDAEGMHELIGRMAGDLKGVSLPIVGELQTLASPPVLDGMEDIRLAADAMAAAFESVAWSVSGLVDALKNGDWAGAARGLTAVVDNLKTAWASGDRSQRYSAVGGLFSGAGAAVGGNGGVALNAIGSGFSAAGAAASMSGLGALGGAIAGLAGPIGIAMGAISLFSGMSARKAAKKAEAERQALEAYTRRMEILAQKRELELRVMELQGNAAGALAQRRADELAAMDAETRALQAQIFALEDKAELEAKRASFDAAFLTQAEAMQETMEAVAGELARLGYAGISTRDQFKALVLGLDHTTEAGEATYRALMDVAPKFLEVADYLDQVRAAAEGEVEGARQALIAAYERESGALKAVIDKFKGFSDALRRFRDGLMTGSAANLLPATEYRVTRERFMDARARAAAGDEQAIEDLPGYAQDFLAAAKAIAPDAAAYARDLAQVRNSVQAAERIAESEADLARAQLSALEAQVGQLVDLNAGVMSVAEAIAHLAATEAQAAADIAAAVAQATTALSIPPAPADTKPKIWTPEGYANANPDVAAWAQGIIGTKGYDGQVITSVDQALAYHWRHHGSTEGRGFATGGSFTVGGWGGPDSQFMPLWLTPGEMVDVRRPGQSWTDGAASELSEIRVAVEHLVVKSGSTLRRVERLMDGWDQNGLFVRGDDIEAPVRVFTVANE